IKVIFLSGYSQEIISHKGIIDDGLQFIEKPAHPNELLLKVRQVLDA
ncbi:MAG: hypothetical protein HQK89_05830, partial [Nitrospirae bacterium]|nr:hypothetical protein [Nitrospirota bacterium]